MSAAAAMQIGIKKPIVTSQLIAPVNGVLRYSVIAGAVSPNKYHLSNS